MADVPPENLRRRRHPGHEDLTSVNTGPEYSALRDRIAHARVSRASVRQRLLLGAGGVVLLAAVGGGGIWIGFLLARDSPPEPARESAVSPAPSKQSAPESRRVETVHEPVAKSVPEPSRAEAIPPPVQPAKAVVPNGQERFQVASRDSERTVDDEPADPQRSPAPGAQAARKPVVVSKEKAPPASGDGDVASTIRLQDGAKREAGEGLRDAPADYRRAIRAAQDAYAAGDAETAGFHLEQARNQRPDDPEVQTWEIRIARLPELLAERRKAENARKAGDLRAEQAALRRSVALDPADVGAESRIGAIEAELHEQAFTQAIARGWRAVDGKHPDRAGQALAEAERLEPRHPETLRLKTQIAALNRIQARDRHLADAEHAVGRDDWTAALHKFEQAKALAPAHDEAVQGGTLAARIVAAQKAMDDFLARPERLGSPNVAEAARKTLRGAAPLTAHSPKLKESGAALTRAVDVWQTPVPVRILSDNQTEIGIRGVGTIGRIEDRIIELLPGAYVFKGKRKGYRSKLVDVAVRSNGGTPAEVRIICDERS